jgi:hypothetical protein
MENGDAVALSKMVETLLQRLNRLSANDTRSDGDGEPRVSGH